VLIAEVNQRMPVTAGAPRLPLDAFAATISTDRPLREAPARESDDVERAIAGYVADLVEDGDTLQIGVGSLPAAVLAALTDHTDLGMHTGMITDGVLDLLDHGALTGRKKEIDRGLVITGAALGSAALYARLGDYPIEFRPASYTHAPAVLSSLGSLVSINSAIEVDLTGQVVADSIGHTMYSGVGGQMDFIRGAGLASEGRSVIALPSTAASGTASRIVDALREGAGVVTTRAHVRTVVTEWGVAELFGKSLRERAMALIAVAHPDFRADLRREASRRHLI
jgi:acyl-CoA hydrolase